MINTKDFYEYLLSKEIDFFAGVPDSLLKNLCSCIKDNTPREKNIITANEGNAVGMCSGYNISTGKYGVVYMQNSGLGNVVNPLLSLDDEEVYSIPMLLIIGWRGEPGKHDEPQHVKQGKVTLKILDAIDVKYEILDDNYKEQIDKCVELMHEFKKPVALVVRKNTFSEYLFPSEVNPFSMTREQALKEIISCLNDEDLVVSTTGKTSREVFEIREANHQGHSNDFLTVGSMGHTSSIAYGISIGTDKNVYCIDGDGSFIMHMGAAGVIGSNSRKNFKYILNNNGAHESVGGQPTCAFDLDIPSILKACGFINVHIAKNIAEIDIALKMMRNEDKTALILYTKQGSREDLGRPTITPIKNKENMMKKIGEKKDESNNI
jgi:phosphonopyruvate decarboxylase